jgi:hypothetical protein
MAFRDSRVRSFLSYLSCHHLPIVLYLCISVSTISNTEEGRAGEAFEPSSLDIGDPSPSFAAVERVTGDPIEQQRFRGGVCVIKAVSCDKGRREGAVDRARPAKHASSLIFFQRAALRRLACRLRSTANDGESGRDASSESAILLQAQVTSMKSPLYSSGWNSCAISNK